MFWWKASPGIQASLSLISALVSNSHKWDSLLTQQVRCLSIRIAGVGNSTKQQPREQLPAVFFFKTEWVELVFLFAYLYYSLVFTPVTFCISSILKCILVFSLCTLNFSGVIAGHLPLLIRLPVHCLKNNKQQAPKFSQPRVFWLQNGYFSLKVQSLYLMILKVLNLISTSFLQTTPCFSTPWY